MKYRVLAELLAVRALVLVVLALCSALGLYVGKRGADMRAFKLARANGEYENAPSCPTVIQSKEEKLQSKELDEVSGMAASRRQRDLFWVHNDSGDDARIFAVRRDGELRAEVVLDGIDARDFEDISLHGDTLYVADTGNNLKRRASVQIHVLPEPRIPREGTAVKLHRTPRTVEITYDDGRHDVEAMLVDARGDVYLVHKSHPLAYIEKVGVYRVTAAEMKQKRAVARLVAQLPVGPATAADVSPDGRELAVRNYFGALWWKLADGESPLDAFKRPPCRFWLREYGLQGESLTFLPDGSGFLTLSEGKHPHIVKYTYGPPEAPQLSPR
ncbi:MAG: hypothetical protein ABW352_11975 [Polyangiales bacterium]